MFTKNVSYSSSFTLKYFQNGDHCKKDKSSSNKNNIWLLYLYALFAFVKSYLPWLTPYDVNLRSFSNIIIKFTEYIRISFIVFSISFINASPNVSLPLEYDWTNTSLYCFNLFIASFLFVKCLLYSLKLLRMCFSSSFSYLINCFCWFFGSVLAFVSNALRYTGNTPMSSHIASIKEKSSLNSSSFGPFRNIFKGRLGPMFVLWVLLLILGKEFESIWCGGGWWNGRGWSVWGCRRHFEDWIRGVLYWYSLEDDVEEGCCCCCCCWWWLK